MCEGLSFQMNAGDLKLIRGANGSGKSTLLQVLAGLRSPESGAITFEGQALKNHPDYPQMISYIGHHSGMRSNVSTLDNLGFWAQAAGNQSLLQAALRYFDLMPIAHAPIDTLSAGWKQRVSLARLIFSPAKIWLLDEPSSNLDAHGMELLQSLIATRLERGGMVVMASHARIEGREASAIDLFPIAELEAV